MTDAESLKDVATGLLLKHDAEEAAHSGRHLNGARASGDGR